LAASQFGLMQYGNGSLQFGRRGKGEVAMRRLDVMTTEIISVDPDASVHALAALLSERGISGVPVIDAEDRVVGIVSAGDVLHRVETGTERRPEALARR
jgi:CBS domain-containing protein